MASLIVVRGPTEGACYPLGQRTTVVGRDETCHVQVVDDLVSRKHVQLRFDSESGRYHALDMESSNGTFVNDRLVANEVPVTDGDIIGVGGSELMFSAMDIINPEAALDHYRQRGERGRSTLIR